MVVAMDTLGIGRTAMDHMAIAPGVITATRFMGRTAMVAIIPISTAADFRRPLLRLHRHLLSHPDSKKVGDQSSTQMDPRVTRFVNQL